MKLNEEKDQRYLLLNSLKQVIHRHSTDRAKASSFSVYVPTIIPILLHNAEQAQDEGVRAECAQSFGALTIIDTSTLLHQLTQLVNNEKAAMRAVAITAIRYSLSPLTDLSLLSSSLPTFLTLLKDQDLTVHRSCLLTINSLAHSHFSLLLPYFSSILPVLYADTKLNPSLIRVVDLGPFKHKVDDGAPIRKAAFQCLDTIYTSSSASALASSSFVSPSPSPSSSSPSASSFSLNVVELVRELKKGFTDIDDIQIQTYELLYKLTQRNPREMSTVIEELPGEIMKGVKEQLKESKGESKPEKAKDVLRVAVRTLERMSRIQGIEKCPTFVEFYQRVLKTGLLIQLLEEMQNNNQ